MTIEQYIKMYQDHYLKLGRSGAGTLEVVRKLDLLVSEGFNGTESVLDYGCGVGSMACVCLASSYLGVDIAPEAIRLAQIDNPDYTFNVFQPGQLKCSKREVIFAFSVFTHMLLDEVGLSLTDLKNALKTDGIAIVDIVAGDKRHDGHVAYWPLGEFMLELDKVGLKGEYIQDIEWNNGFTHTYLRINHA